MSNVATRDDVKDAVRVLTIRFSIAMVFLVVAIASFLIVAAL